MLAHLGHLFAQPRQIVETVAGHQRFKPLMQTGDQRADSFHVAALPGLIQLHHHGVGLFFQIVRHQIGVAELTRLAPEPF
ncbi:hypothetical protein D3C75_813180 [compost metagenome]